MLMPFSRDVQLSQAKVKDGRERIAEMVAHLQLCQNSKAVVCLARESRLSLELKAEVRFGDTPSLETLDLWPFIDTKTQVGLLSSSPILQCVCATIDCWVCCVFSSIYEISPHTTGVQCHMHTA